MSKYSRYIEYGLVYMLISLSGGLRFSSLPDKFLIVILAFLLVYVLLLVQKRLNLTFIIYMCIAVMFLLAVHFYTEKSLSFNSIIGFSVKLSIAYLILVILGDRFPKVYINLLSFLAVVSLVGYLLDITGVLKSLVFSLPALVDGQGYEGFLYVFSHPTHIDRNQSIFYEPGAYQVYLNVGLIMLLFFNHGFSEKKRNLLILVYVLCIATTISTTGIILLAGIIAIAILSKSQLKSFQKALVIFAMMLGAGTLSNYLYPVVAEKVGSYVSGGDIAHGGSGGSGDRRAFDAKIDLEIFKREILGVGHKRYFELFSAIGRTDASSSSNGITKTLAVYGLPFSIFLFFSFYIGIKAIMGSMFLTHITYVLFIIFIMSQDYFVFAPVSFAIIAAIFISMRKASGQALEGREKVT